MKTAAVIMAGGRGERFWPKSRTDHPKQFLSLTADGQTMIQKTVSRLLPLVAAEDIYVVTNARYAALVQEQLPMIRQENILSEPCARNTAPCIGLAASVIQKRSGDCMMFVLPSDHLIRYEELYIDVLRQAVRAAQTDDALVTIGITPTYPETGYGYIHFERDEGIGMTGVYRAAEFVEKPDYETAKTYLNTGRYLWNSGMFVWRTCVVLEKIKQYMPSLYAGLERIEAAVDTPAFDSVLAKEYDQFDSVSIDVGIMERAENILTLPGNFGWDDVGSWLAVERINNTNDAGNYVTGDVITIDTHHSTICGGKRLLAVVGVENLVIVDTDDALLICDKNNTQDVKKVIETLRICNRDELV